MIDLTEQQLSDAMFELAKELNRGCWLPDRAGIPTEMVSEVTVQAIVTVLPGQVLVESIAISQTGEGVQTGEVVNNQSGDNVNVTTNDYTEI